MQERLKLDLYQKTSASQGITTRVNDGGEHKITATALAYGDAFDLTGWKIKFELTTSAKTIAIDSVNAKITTAKSGEFSYTIPKEMTGVAGNAERAYFAFEKDKQRITSADINMTILQIVDITAEEARSYIAEYNKLVAELNAITDKYIADSDKKFADINKKIADLQTKIAQSQTAAKDIADVVDNALKKFEDGNFYTKPETDAKFKAVNDLIVSQDIPEGVDLDDYKKEGEFSKKTPTVVTGVPEGVTGAFRLSVRAMVGSSGIFQTLYDYATRAIYYRIGNTSLGFNIAWQRIANNSEVVHLTGDETIAGKKTFTEKITVSDDVPETTVAYGDGFASYAGQAPIFYKQNGRVYLEGACSPTKIIQKGGGVMFTLPVGCRPSVPLTILCQGSGMNVWAMTIEMDGQVKVLRYRATNTTTSETDIPAGAWLPFVTSFKAGDSKKGEKTKTWNSY